MFGYIVCNKNKLSEEELERYQSTYCGMCRALKHRFGEIERMSLNFDMTFLAIMLNSLYDEDNNSTNIRCLVHPFSTKHVLVNKYIDDAADMTILLAYYKSKDDWSDERKVSSRVYQKILNKHYKQLEDKYPRQTKCVRESLERLAKIESNAESIPDEAINCSGMMMSELFVYKEDFWSESLRIFGYELGRFIYLMDATIDYEYDIKKHNYNPLIGMKLEPKDMQDILMSAIGNVTVIFEQLPLVEDVNIMRNVLYGGVWQQYKSLMEKNKKDKCSKCRKEKNNG